MGIPKIEVVLTQHTHAEGLPLPRYMTESASGMDLVAAIDIDRTLQPLDRHLIPTGLTIALPVGYEAQIRPRSGLALKQGITVLNTPGTIDADYRGEIGVVLINLSRESFAVSRGMRIAQMVIAPIVHANFNIHDTLSLTARSAGGFGHTGL